MVEKTLERMDSLLVMGLDAGSKKRCIWRIEVVHRSFGQLAFAPSWSLISDISLTATRVVPALSGLL